MKKQFVVITVVLAAACSSAPKPAATPSTPPAAPSRVAIPSCPDTNETHQMVEASVSVIARAMQTDPAVAVPSCFAVAVAKSPYTYPDSTVVAVVKASDATAWKTPADAANLQARLSLLTRAGRAKEVPATFNALVARDPSKATLEDYRLAIAASMRAHDTASRIRLLAAATRKYPTAASLIADYNILRQVKRLYGLPDSVYQILRLSPGRSDLYATLASVYGNLDRPDSAIHFTRLALQKGVSRQAAAASLQSLVGVTLRKAQLLNAPDVWESTLPVARSIDSVLSTDMSKHLYALTLIQVSAARVEALTRVLGGPLDIPRQINPDVKNQACAQLRVLPRYLDAASERLSSGGSRFSSETMPALNAGMSKVREQIDLLEGKCAS
jgi:hypothetical protein